MKRVRTAAILLALSAVCLVLAKGVQATAQDNGRKKLPGGKHVLLISIDGMHSQDLAKWIQNNSNSTLANLAASGVNYLNAFTTQPSDSIPSTVGIFTGASPKLEGMYYDDAWHRSAGGHFIFAREFVFQFAAQPFALHRVSGLCSFAFESGNFLVEHANFGLKLR